MWVGTAQYSAKYLEDIALLKYWREYLPLVAYAAPKAGEAREVDEAWLITLGIPRCCSRVSQNLVTVLATAIFTKDMIASIGMRLRYVDEILGSSMVAWTEAYSLVRLSFPELVSGIVKQLTDVSKGQNMERGRASKI